MQLLSNIYLNRTTELSILRQDGETEEKFSIISLEQILLRWMNYHLQRAGYEKKINNFGPDMKVSESFFFIRDDKYQSRDSGIH
jgi:hypothetical protein